MPEDFGPSPQELSEMLKDLPTTNQGGMTAEEYMNHLRSICSASLSRKERIERLAKFIAIAQLSSGPDFSKIKNLEEMLENSERVGGGFYCMAYNIYGFFEREGWVQNETTA